MYDTLVTIHSIVRWLVVIAAVLALAAAYRGWSGKRAWGAFENTTGLAFTSLFDLQAAIGLIIFFFVSPITSGLFRNFNATIADPSGHYFTFEHMLPMLIALAVAHVGRSRSKKAATDKGKFRQAAIFFTIAVVIVLVSIPWPFMPVARDWL
jgi:hypothetical protein